MNAPTLTSHVVDSFRRIGAEVRAVAAPAFRSRFSVASSERIRIRNDVFELVLPTHAQAFVVDCRRADRHLVLSMNEPGTKPQKFLCGFDERQWFVAGVRGTTVREAKESLMPGVVHGAIHRTGLRHAHRHRRHTAAFVRQGEWFFVPLAAPVEIELWSIRRNEPLIRPGGGKPHIVAELVRPKGESVWFHPRHGAAGLTDAQFRRLPEDVRKTPRWERRVRFRQGAVLLARGSVRHPDHATIHLRDWHQVVINDEQRPASLGFLD